MLILADRVKESSLSTGVGAVTLNGPVAGYQAFSGVLSSGDQTYYTIVNNQAWEVGVGTYSSSSISRDTILSSSTGSKINLSGQSFVFIAYPAEKSVYRNVNDQIVVTDSGIRFNDGTVQTTAGGGGSYTAGNGLQLSGSQFSVDNTVVQSGDNISVLVNNVGYLTSHPSITAASSSNNGGRTYIQDILLDSNGHVTGITTATEMMVDTDTTYSAGTGLQLSGTTFNVDSSVIRSGNNISLLNNNSNYTTSGSNIGQFVNDVGYLTSHPTISAASSSNNSGRTYIQDILLDSNGHITGIVTATETVTDTDTTYSAGTGLQLSGTTFSIDSTVARSGNNITIFTNDAGYLTSHPTIVAASSVDNAAHYFVQDLMLDSNGHITGVVSTSETIHAAGDGLTFDGVEFAVDSTVARVGMELSQFNNNSTKFISSGNNVSLLTNDAGYLTSHPSISGASSSNNSGRTYIQDILLDSNGHVTGVATATETVVDTDTTYSAGSGLVLSGTQFNTAGTGNFSSIVLQAGTPASTTNQLYNIGGVLYFNGSGLGGSGGGGGSYNAGSGLILSGSTFHASGNLSRLSNWPWSSGTEIPAFTGINQISTINIGGGANQIPQLDSSGRYPAADGSLITNSNIVCNSPSGDVTFAGTGGSWTIEPTGLSLIIPSTGKWVFESAITAQKGATGTLTGCRLAFSTASISGVTGRAVGSSISESTASQCQITTGSPTVVSMFVRSPSTVYLAAKVDLIVHVIATGLVKVQMYDASSATGTLTIFSNSYIKAAKI